MSNLFSLGQNDRADILFSAGNISIMVLRLFVVVVVVVVPLVTYSLP